MILFAEVDWTEVIQTVGAAFVVVIGALGGWYLKIISVRHKHEIKMAEKKAELEEKERIAEAVRKKEEEERQAEAEKKRERAEQKKDLSLASELRNLLEAATSQHTEDRESIHEFRNRIQTLESRIAVCETQRIAQTKQLEDQTRQLHALYDRLGMDFERQNRIVSLDDSKLRRALGADQKSPTEDKPDVG